MDDLNTNDLRLFSKLLTALQHCTAGQQSEYENLEYKFYFLMTNTRSLLRKAHSKKFSTGNRPEPPLCIGYDWGAHAWDWMYWSAKRKAGWHVGWGFSIEGPPGLPNVQISQDLRAFVAVGSDSGDTRDRVIPALVSEDLVEFESKGWRPEADDDWLVKTKDNATNFANDSRGFTTAWSEWLISSVEEAVQILKIAQVRSFSGKTST